MKRTLSRERKARGNRKEATREAGEAGQTCVCVACVFSIKPLNTKSDVTLVSETSEMDPSTIGLPQDPPMVTRSTPQTTAQPRLEDIIVYAFQ
jgi:hypothetical protein